MTERAEPEMELPPQIDRNFDGQRAVYLDLNHWIHLARVARGQSTPPGYPELLTAARQARTARTALFPLSQTHYMEMSGIADPRQRRNVAAIMEELSEIHVLLGRTTVMRLEMDAALDRLQGVPTPAGTVPLLGRTGLWAYGRNGRLRLAVGGLDLTEYVQGQEWFRLFEREFERRMLEGPSDAEDALLRQTTEYNPEAVHAIAEQRAEQERAQAARIDEDPKWRRGRLRDLVSARELAAEWLDLYTNRVIARGTSLDDLFGPNGEAIRGFVDGMPSNSVVISLKTAYHRNQQHQWRVNDIHDIDALAIAVPYCDAVLTDKAARNAIVTMKVDRRAATFMPRTPGELALWLDGEGGASAPSE
jgi:hypothetical protein